MHRQHVTFIALALAASGVSGCDELRVREAPASEDTALLDSSARDTDIATLDSADDLDGAVEPTCWDRHMEPGSEPPVWFAQLTHLGTESGAPSDARLDAITVIKPDGCRFDMARVLQSNGEGVEARSLDTADAVEDTPQGPVCRAQSVLVLPAADGFAEVRSIVTFDPGDRVEIRDASGCDLAPRDRPRLELAIGYGGDPTWVAPVVTGPIATITIPPFDAW